jgi:hypothetical protein
MSHDGVIEGGANAGNGRIVVRWPGSAPETGPATHVTESQATVHGTVLVDGETYRYDYGTTTSYGASTTESTADTAGADLAATITGLSAGTTYHYRILSLTDNQPGQDLTLTTAQVLPPATVPPIEPTTTSTSVPPTTTTAPKPTTTTTPKPTTTLAPTTTTPPPPTTAPPAADPPPPVMTETAATSTTTEPPTTTTEAPTTTTTEAPTPTTVPAKAKPIEIAIEGEAGVSISKTKVIVRAGGLSPGTSVRITAHSTPVLLGEGTAGDDGRFEKTVFLPPTLEPGSHRIIVSGTNADGTTASKETTFSIASGGFLGAVGSTPKGVLATYVPYKPTEHVGDVLQSTAGGVAAVGAVGAAMRGSGGSRGGGGGRSSGSEGAFLLDVELEREKEDGEGEGIGDASRTWRWPWTGVVDRFSRRAPALFSRVSPCLGRVATDGDYLRAMFGGLWLFLFVPAIALGLLAARSTGGAAVPPTLGLFAAVLALSIFDSILGYTAGVVFCLAVAAMGGVTGTSDIRALSGVVLVWFSVPLGAAAIRPLRRRFEPTLVGAWDRMADYVLGALFGAWIASQMASLLSALRGYAVPIAEHGWFIAELVVVVLAVRVLLETVAAHHYPDRLAAVLHEGDLEGSKLQMVIALVASITVFFFISLAYMPFGVALVAGAVVFYSPLIPWLFAERIPKYDWVERHNPTGLAKWTWVIVGTVVLDRILSALVHNDTDLLAWGFILLPLPVLLSWGADLFIPDEEEDEEEEAVAEEPTGPLWNAPPPVRERVWTRRLIGVPAVALCGYLVLSGAV